MAVKISELPTIATLTNDDFFIVNDNNSNTSKISYRYLKDSLISVNELKTILSDSNTYEEFRQRVLAIL